MKSMFLGEVYVNEHLMGIFMKEMVRRSILAIRDQLTSFEFETKKGYSGNMDDLVTSADRLAQKVCLKSLNEAMPEFGIIAEEGELKKVSSFSNASVDFYFTLDPLDGTKAFGRKQSHGFGPMISLVYKSIILAAYVGDAMTQEIYGYRPLSEKVHRIRGYKESEHLVVNVKPLKEQYVLLKDNPFKYSTTIQKVLKLSGDIRIFRDLEVMSGGIGVCAARLWKGEVGAMILRPQHQTPWDLCPFVGISQKMGFTFFKVNTKSNKLEVYNPKISKEIYKIDHEVIVVHQDNARELVEFFNS